VGKTTCAARLAVARAAAGARVLVLSTDPAHSLGDVLGVRLSARPTRVARGLDAVEVDAPRAFARWLDAHRHALGDVLEQGTWLERSDIDALLDLTMPGVDELVGLLEIARLGAAKPARGGRPRAAYDLVVVDTAPTGHARRLLAAPDTVTALTHVLDELRAEHRIIRERLVRVGRPEAADVLIEQLASQAQATWAELRDPRRTSFQWVTLPESLSIAESEDGIAALAALGIAVADIVVNRVLTDEGPCPLCDRRRVEEKRAIAIIRRSLGRGRRVRLVPSALREPRGLAALKKLASTARLRDARQRAPARTSEEISSPAPLGLDSIAGAELLFVGGKGGVGKTTVAAAIALQLARAMPGESILLLSTDPAHSLGDVFESPVGDRPESVPGAPANLFVRELDAAAALKAKRADLVAALDELGSLLGSADTSAEELIELAPPGIDEVFGMLSVIDARSAHRIVVVDMAPTGHALRLLAMPEAVREWTQVLLRVLLKYRSVARPGKFAAELVEASKSIRELQTLLRDETRTRFLVVTRAAAVPRAETERLLHRLRALKLATPTVVVNARTLSPGSCRRCRATAAAERRELTTLARSARAWLRPGTRRDCAIIQTPLAAPPPRGPSRLDRWARTWIA
jgi:arsenite-transporting ATPase